MTPKTSINVSLDFSVPVKGEDGKAATRDTITIKRPRTAHAKRLAALIGADFAKALLSSGDAKNVDAKELFSTLSVKLFEPSVLDELISIIASMCDESPAFVDELDVEDMFKILKALTGFFPALQSLMSSNTAQT